MTSTSLRRRALAGALVGLGLLAGCNLVLGIEEHGARPVPDDAAPDAGEETSVAARPSFEHCSRDTDCVAPNGCYTPHCDTVLGACTYALCEAKGRTCAAGVCDTKTFACSDAQPYGFLATTYDVSGITSGCGPSPGDCVAAAFPFLFLGTRDSVVALRTDDLLSTAPAPVPIVDLTVRPQQLVSSGRRIWILGDVQGQAPPYRLPVAVVDVPSDPTVVSLRARTAVVTYPFPTATGFAAPNGGLYLTHPDAAQSFPTSKLDDLPAGGATFVPKATGDAGAPDASVPPGPTVPMFRAAGVPAGAELVATSGGRLVLHRFPSTFNLVSAPGTAAAATSPDLPLNQPFVPIGPYAFAQGPDGVVMMSGPVAANPAGDCNCTTHARVQWLFPNAAATATDVNQLGDPDGWTNPLAPAGICNQQCTGDYFRPGVLTAWIDRRSALTASPFSGAGEPPRHITDLRLFGRDPIDADPKRRAQTRPTSTPRGDFSSDRIALTSSNGFGYLVLADDQGNDVSLSVVDPRCDAK